MPQIKLVSYTQTEGGKSTIVKRPDGGVSGGATNLNQLEMNAHRKARLTADIRNGGDMEKAKQILESAGFVCYWE